MQPWISAPILLRSTWLAGDQTSQRHSSDSRLIREADALSATDEGRLIRKVQVALFMDGKLDSDAFQPLPAVMQFI
jgi:hypothetical protein